MHIFLALQIIGPTVPVGRSIIMAVCRLISAVCLCVAHSMKPTAHRMISWRVLGGLWCYGSVLVSVSINGGRWETQADCSRRLSVVAIVGQLGTWMKGSPAAHQDWGGFATLSVGVCKNEPANEPSELATPLHRNGDAWGAHLTGCGYNEPACVCTSCSSRDQSARKRDALSWKYNII